MDSRDFADRGIVQAPARILHEVAKPFAISDDREEARHIERCLQSFLHEFIIEAFTNKPFGVSAPQLGFCRRIAIVVTTTGQSTTLLNPELVYSSDELDDQYEGCMSFFDVRGLVRRPLSIVVRTTISMAI